MSRKKWLDIILPIKGLLDSVASNTANPEYASYMKNFTVDNGVLKTIKGYIINSTADINAYSTGSCVCTHNSKTVTGIGTSWDSDSSVFADLSFLNMNDTARGYVIEEIVSDTELTLSSRYDGPTTDQSLTVDTDYTTGCDKSRAICYDGSVVWSIINDSGTYKIRKHQADLTEDTTYSLGAGGNIDVATGITYMSSRIWVSGYNSTSGNQYIQKYLANMSDIDTEYDLGADGILEWDVEYDGSVLPQNDTPAWTKSAAGTYTESSDGDILSLTADSGPNGIIYYRDNIGLSNSTGFTVEVKVKCIDGDGFSFEVKDGTQFWWVFISPDAVSSYQGGSKVSYSVDTTDDYHVYRFVASGTTGKVYMDGNEILSDINPASTTIYNKVTFGIHFNPLENIDVDIDYVKYYSGGMITPGNSQIGDIAHIGTTLYSFVKSNDNYNILKHDAGIITFTEYRTDTTYLERGLSSDGSTYLYMAKRALLDGVLTDYICQVELNDSGHTADVLVPFNTGISHDEAAGDFLRGIAYDSSVLWSCRNDSGTTKISKYQASTGGDSYIISGVTDNLYTFNKWDGTEVLIWSSIPKGMVAYSKDAKDWYILKTGLNSTAHVNFETYMNHLFSVNGVDTPWSWDGSDAITGTTSSNGNVGGTTVICDEASFDEADDYWNGCAIVLTSGDYSGEIREISDWDQGTDTFTVSSAFSGQVVSGITFYVSYTIDDPNEISGGVVANNGGSTSMPDGGIIKVHQHRLWVTDKDSPNLVRCSGLYFETDTDMSDTWDAEQTLKIANKDVITGMYSTGERTYVFGEERPYVLTGGTAFVTYRLIGLADPTGLFSDRAAQTCVNYINFCGRKGIYRVLGSELRELSAPIENLFSKIQQTQLYHETWGISSETEFDATGSSYDSNKLVTGFGNLELKPYIKTWDSKAEWDTYDSVSNVKTDDGNISLVNDVDDKGSQSGTAYLSDNIAPSLGIMRCSRRLLSGSLRNLTDGNVSTRASVDASSKDHVDFSIGLQKDRRIKKVIVRVTATEQRRDAWFDCALSTELDGTFTTQETQRKYDTDGAGDNYAVRRYDIVFNLDAHATSIKLDFDSSSSTYVYHIWDIEIYEWIDNISYSTTRIYRDSGYIVMTYDSGVTSPIWRYVTTDRLLNNCTYTLEARVSTDNLTWSDWVSVSEGGTPDVSNYRYIQIKLTLITDESGVSDNNTPVFNRLSVEFYKYLTDTYTSPTQNLSTAMSAWDIFSVSYDTPTGTSLKFEVTSADIEGNLGTGSYPWVEITPGDKPTGYIGSSAATWFRWRVTLYTTNQDTPTVGSANIWWWEGGTQTTPICTAYYDNKFLLSVAMFDKDGNPSKFNNRIIVLNKYGGFETIEGQNVSGFAMFKNRLYGGAADCGLIYMLDEGDYQKGNAVEADFRTMEYDFSKYFRADLVNNYKSVLQIFCEGKGQTSTIYLGVSTDSGSNWEEISVDLSNLKHYQVAGDKFKVREYLPVGVLGKSLMFRVRCEPSEEQVEIHRIRAEVEATTITGE